MKYINNKKIPVVPVKAGIKILNPFNKYTNLSKE